MKRALVVSTALLLISGLAVAAPGMQITKPPVVGPLTGPDNDPPAMKGLWFIPRTTPLPLPGQRIGTTWREWEFYDDSLPQGGGAFGFGAIRSGTVYYYDRDSGVGYNSGPDGIMDTFGIDIFVTDDCPATNPQWPGVNSHNESSMGSAQWECNMTEVKATAEFAVDINNGFPPAAPNPPYFPPGNIVYQAVNHNELAWYSYNTDQDANFWVPTWDLPDIAHNQSVRVEMQFYVGNTGILALGTPLRGWLDGLGDKFYNRTESSLKISQWVESSFGPGAPYDSQTLVQSNVGVFFMPEPTSLLLILAGAAGLLRRRR